MFFFRDTGLFDRDLGSGESGAALLETIEIKMYLMTAKDCLKS